MILQLETLHKLFTSIRITIKLCTFVSSSQNVAHSNLKFIAPYESVSMFPTGNFQLEVSNWKFPTANFQVIGNSNINISLITESITLAQAPYIQSAKFTNYSLIN